MGKGAACAHAPRLQARPRVPTGHHAPPGRPPRPQATLGFLLPALGHVALEARLFTRHQQQRRRAGLAGESGCQAAVYHSLEGLLEVLAWPQAVLAVGILLSISWDLSLLAATAGGDAPM